MRNDALQVCSDNDLFEKYADQIRTSYLQIILGNRDYLATLMQHIIKLLDLSNKKALQDNIRSENQDLLVIMSQYCEFFYVSFNKKPTFQFEMLSESECGRTVFQQICEKYYYSKYLHESVRKNSVKQDIFLERAAYYGSVNAMLILINRKLSLLCQVKSMSSYQSGMTDLMTYLNQCFPVNSALKHLITGYVCLKILKSSFLNSKVKIVRKKDLSFFNSYDDLSYEVIKDCLKIVLKEALEEFIELSKTKSSKMEINNFTFGKDIFSYQLIPGIHSIRDLVSVINESIGSSETRSDYNCKQSVRII